MTEKFLILDRDGVINYDSPAYIKSPEEWRAIPGSLEAIASLNENGYQIFLVTNQSGVARGYYDLATLHRIHDKLLTELKKVGGIITEIFFCPHHPDENCECRKPKPGMLLRIKQKYQIDLHSVYFIGDSLSDIQVAEEVGCQPILVKTGNGTQLLLDHPHLSHIPHFENLAMASHFILMQGKNKK